MRSHRSVIGETVKKTTVTLDMALASGEKLKSRIEVKQSIESKEDVETMIND